MKRAAALLSFFVLFAGCKARETAKPPTPSTATASAGSSPDRPPLVVRVPSIHIPIKLDGELSEPPWNAISARTQGFVDTTGHEARPYSEGRFLWDNDNLYLALYAADDNIQATVTQHDGPVWIEDAFDVQITPMEPGKDAPSPGGLTFVLNISAAGVVTDLKRVTGAKDDLSWESGIKLGVDRDGTLNKAEDIDEEWVIEASIPLASMGLAPKPGTRFAVAISRCDTPRRTKEKRCGAWGTPGHGHTLELAP